VSGIDGAKGLMAVGVGTGRITVDGVVVVLDRLYYVPGSTQTLMSVSSLVAAGHRCTFEMVRGRNTLTLCLPDGGAASLVVNGGLYDVPAEQCADGGAIFEDDWEPDDLPGGMRGFAMMKGVQVGNTHVGTLTAGELFHQRLAHYSGANATMARHLANAYGPSIGKGCNLASCPP